MNPIAPGTMIRFGWETFKKRPWFFLGALLCIWILSGVFSQLGTFSAQVHFVGAIAAVFVGVVGQMFIKMGTTNFLLKGHDTPEGVQLKDFWAPEMFWPYVGATVFVGIIVVVGIILLIIPGIIFALRYLFVPYLVIDKKYGVMHALRESARISHGHKWQLLGLVIVLALFNILGLLALIVGILVTIPVSMFALVHAYRTLEHSASEVAP